MCHRCKRSKQLQICTHGHLHFTHCTDELHNSCCLNTSIATWLTFGKNTSLIKQSVSVLYIFHPLECSQFMFCTKNLAVIYINIERIWSYLSVTGYKEGVHVFYGRQTPGGAVNFTMNGLIFQSIIVYLGNQNQLKYTWAQLHIWILEIIYYLHS